eukprot:Rmarinus@m.1619
MIATSHKISKIRTATGPFMRMATTHKALMVTVTITLEGIALATYTLLSDITIMAVLTTAVTCNLILTNPMNLRTRTAIVSAITTATAATTASPVSLNVPRDRTRALLLNMGSFIILTTTTTTQELPLRICIARFLSWAPKEDIGRTAK